VTSEKTRPEFEPDAAITAQWEDGTLGRSEEHAAIAPAGISADVDKSLDLQLVSIRLQKGLINSMKIIAKYRGVGYQPLMRDLLNRFAVSELRAITMELERKQQQLLDTDRRVIEDLLDQTDDGQHHNRVA